MEFSSKFNIFLCSSFYNLCFFKLSMLIYVKGSSYRVVCLGVLLCFCFFNLLCQFVVVFLTLCVSFPRLNPKREYTATMKHKSIVIKCLCNTLQPARPVWSVYINSVICAWKLFKQTFNVCET